MWKKLVHRASANTGMVPDFKSSQNEKKNYPDRQKQKRKEKRRETPLCSLCEIIVIKLLGWMDVITCLGVQ
jgi:hypothetical protein